MIELQSIPIGQVVPNPGQPRKAFDRTALAELADSIRSVGVLEPIVVRPQGWTVIFDDRGRTAGPLHYEIVAGERRWRAATDAGLSFIPALVRDDLDDRSAFELSMIENVIRTDMNPIEEAVGYQHLLDEGLTIETISERLGKSAAAIKSRIKLLSLAPAISDLVASGQLDSWTASHMTKLSHESQFKVIRAITEGLLAKGDNNAADRLCSALAERDSRVDMFDDDFMQPGQPTSPFVVPVPDAGKVATRKVGDEIQQAIEMLEEVASSLESGVNPPADSRLLSEHLAKITGRVTKAIHKADAVRLASEL